MLKSKEIVVDNLRINYIYKGNLQDNPVVFLPGWMAEPKLYFKFLTNIKDLVILDWPGFFKSEEPLSVWGIKEYSDFLKKFLKKLNIKKCILIGHSFGGAVALYYASCYPQKLDKLILVAASCIRHKGWKYNLKIKIFQAMAKLLKVALSFLMFFKIYNKIKRKLYCLIDNEDYLVDGRMKEIYLKIIRTDLQDKMSKIKVPTFLIWGDKDKSVPIKEAYTIQHLIKNSQIKIIKNAGHFPFLDNPKEWENILNSFLNF